jgi:hypothetical protein
LREGAYGFEGGDFGFLVVGCGVVHRHAAALLLEAEIGHEWDAVEGAVSVAEEEDGGPVVGQVLGEGAGGAGGVLRDVGVGVHFRGEGVAADKLVEVRGGDEVGGDEAGMEG